MPGNDEILRAQAVIIDQATATLQKIDKSVRDLNRTVKQSGEENRRHFEQMNRVLKPLGEQFRDVINPAMAAFGLGSLTLGGIIVGLTSQLNKLAESQANVGRVAGQTKMAPSDVSAWLKAAEDAGIAREAMSSEMVNFTRN